MFPYLSFALILKLFLFVFLFLLHFSFNKVQHGHCERNANDQNTTNQDQPYEAEFSGGA